MKHSVSPEDGGLVELRGPGAWRQARTLGVDALMALGQVTGFFLAFVAILSMSFPQGTSLNTLYRDWVGLQSVTPAVAHRSTDAPLVARLSSVTRQVKQRSARAVAWSAAASGMDIEDQHAIQTFSRSGAELSFNERDRIELGENSLVVIKKPQTGRFRPRQASVLLLGGRVRGRVEPSGARMAPLEIHTGKMRGTLLAGEQTPAEFEVEINPDESSTLTVFSGSARIQSGEGTALVEPNQAITVSPEGVLGRAMSVPGVPRAKQPEDGARVTYGPTVREVEFSWSPVESAERYRLQIAKDPEFRSLIHDARIESPATRVATLGLGLHHWRVRGVNGGGQGTPGPARSFEVVADEQAPELQVSFPEGPVHRRSYDLTGEADSGCTVRIDGSPIEVDRDGRFVHSIALDRGPNLVVVEAVDAVGNIAFRSSYIHAKF